MEGSTPSPFISNLTSESLLSTSPRSSSLQSNAKLQGELTKCKLKPFLAQEYASQKEKEKKNGEPAIASINDTAEPIKKNFPLTC